MDPIILLELVIFVGLLGLSGFFSGSETALFSLNQTQLEQMEMDRNPQSGLVKSLLNEPRRLIVTILIGNELVNVSASVISATLVIQLMGGEDKWWVNIFIMLPILLLFGEITPKTLAMKHNVRFASRVSPLLEIFAKYITPLRIAVRYVADNITTLIIGKERSKGNIITEDMVRTLAVQAADEGALDKNERQYIDNIFDFGNKTVLDLMTPRSNMFVASLNKSGEQIVKLLKSTSLTRIPVYDKHKDDIIGILHVRDLMDPKINVPELDIDGLRDLLRKPMFVPKTKSVTELFFKFRQQRLSIAMVLDEFGGIIGLVTMDDLLGAIFGSLQHVPDMSGKATIGVNGESIVVVDGDMSIAKFNKTMKTNLSVNIASTIGGWLLHKVGELPEEGYTVEADGWHFAIVKVANNRILEVECRREKSPDLEFEDIDYEEDSEDTADEPKKSAPIAKKDTN
ncbi:MAG: HlyC/CorC family transporter [Magnetococcales bacterium]|nr:HlyC/CorC family transporter [Magnetococcales bacterium]